jgi:hypothetical protein
MKILKLLLAVVVVSLLFSECRYSFIVPEEVPPVIDPEDPNAPQISFSTQILPIFNDGNNCTSCHKTGGQMPDLTTDNAYTSINKSRYINSGTPEQSLIYTYPHPDTPTHVRKKYSATQAATILLWIQQGAKNN